jgi:hypothetical protein
MSPHKIEGAWWLLDTWCVSPHPHLCVIASGPALLHCRTLHVWPPGACFDTADHHRSRPTTLPLSTLDCSVVEPCDTSTISSHGAPLICSRSPPRVTMGERLGAARGEAMLLARERWSSIAWGRRGAGGDWVDGVYKLCAWDGSVRLVPCFGRVFS